MTLTGATTTSLSVSWPSVSGAAGYGLFLNGSTITTTQATTYTFGNLACGSSYTLGVNSVTSTGNKSRITTLIASTGACQVADTSPPTTPTLLTQTGSSVTSASLSWTASLDNVAVAGYGLYVNGARVATTTWATYTVANLTCGTNYTLGLDAYDAAGNRSAQASVIAATSACAVSDTQAPSAPAGVAPGTASTTGVSLVWSASSDNVGVVGYGLYVNGSRVGSTASTSYAFGGLVCGSVYTLAVDAYDGAGNRSPASSVQASTAACVVASTLGSSLPASLPASTGQAFYVSPTGSDSAPGTLSAPWLTIQKAFDSLLPGQTAYVRAGTYPEWAVLTRSGTATAPITLRAYPGERPVLTGRLRLVGSYARVSGFLFQGRTAANATGVLVYVSGGDHDELSGNELRDSAMSAIYVGDPGNDADHLFIVGNYIHDNGTHSNLDHGIYFGSGSNGLISDNVIEHNLAQGIKLAPAAQGTIATANTVVRNGASGILVGGDTVDISNNNLVVNNITAFNTGWGIRSYWESAGIGIGNQATRNLIYSNGSGVSWFPGGGLTLTDSLLGNPMFINLTGGDYYLLSGSPALGAALPAYSPSNAYNGPRGPVPDLGALDG